MNYKEIPIEQIKDREIIVCHDPYKRLGDLTWIVVKYYEGIPKLEGAFINKNNAINFSKIL